MKSMRVVLPAFLMFVPIQVARAADSGALTLGPNLGIGLVDEPGTGSDAVTSIGVPSGGGLLFGSLQPGMRFGYVGPSGRFDVYLDVALNYARSERSSFHTFLGGLNLQYNFLPEAVATPYVTAGGGFLKVGGDFIGGETDPMLGLGLGVRRMVSEGHGALRAEARYDRLLGGDTSIDLNSFALKLGFDLWIR